MEAQRFLNIGCGQRFHPDWTNIDLVPSSPAVQAVDIQNGLPFPAETFAVVYHSHVLEHLPRQRALALLLECYRVLVPGGVIRVAVPDLERIVGLYGEALERASRGEPRWAQRYEWMLLELYDQVARERPGGDMLAYLRREPLPEAAFVYERLGSEARKIVQSRPRPAPRPALRDLVRRARAMPRFLLTILAQRMLAANDRRALEIGRFRQSGEVHRWMYDHYSLALLLTQAGFQSPVQQTASQSAISCWSRFSLDTEPDGSVYKPDSLYMEALKPTV
jgi:SAM-dependent methyltransferase